MKETQILTRKIKILPIGNREYINSVYKELREKMKVQSKAMNEYISALYLAELNKITKDERKELNNLYGRDSFSKLGSAYSTELDFFKGLNHANRLAHNTRNKFSKQCKDGLMYGKVSLATFKDDSPIFIPKSKLRFSHNYENHQDFLDNLKNKELDIILKLTKEIAFKVILGQPHKSQEIRSVFKNIFEETYKVCDSSIQIDGTKIILNLTLEIPTKEIKLDEDTVVGVDLGLAIPAVCGLNNNNYIRQSIGCANDFLRVRTKIQAQKRSLQQSLKYSSGGHGRKKKLAPLDKFQKYERNFVKTYNHMISKNVVDFAIKNSAKYINLEDLSGFDSNKFILRNWSYYELQQQITYKASKYGIEVRYINPYHTSQNCSQCGHWEEGQRIDQSHFECKCCGHKENADFNASKNIAKSKEFV